ncbi:MAG: nitroreductase family protein [Rhodoferax sp.]|nr:nitroreductase family protein [Rhodoferax sp.]
MNLSEGVEFTSTLIHTRQHVAPRRLVDPGPSEQQMQAILGAAAAAPDHGQLLPWRFVVVPGQTRDRLADVFGQALMDRDPQASPQQIDNAREKAYRAPFLMLAIARLVGSTPEQDARRLAAGELAVTDAERLVSLGCAIQNILLTTHAMGFGSGLTSGQAMASIRLRALFGLVEHEIAVCCINLGTVSKGKPARLRPNISAFVSYLHELLMPIQN